MTTPRQGRAERPINPDDGPTEAFAVQLRQLRAKCGSPTYKELARYAGYSSTALSGAANGQAMPSRQVTLSYVRACLTYAKAGPEERETVIAEWRRRWHDLEAQLASPTDDEETVGPGDDAVPAQVGMEHETPPAPAPVGGDAGPSRHSWVRRLGTPGRRRGVTLLATVAAAVLLLTFVPAQKPAPTAGSAGATPHGTEQPDDIPMPESVPPWVPGEDPSQVQVDPLGRESRCSDARVGPAGVLLRACVRVTDERVFFALKLSNSGSVPVEVTSRLTYFVHGKRHSCQGNGLWHGTLAAGASHTTDPKNCATDRVHSAYQAEGLLALGHSHRWVVHKMSTNAHVWPDRVLWRCPGDVPC
ncbi:helix-turn-helix domain-containing protein [Streptomyces pseudogriseolus]|uniref:helix-turn-helix domain-containing protein n=1 Tax=Streptomyces pseudogriseolus TaxID=36817 RepID=UPI0036B7BA61